MNEAPTQLMQVLGAYMQNIWVELSKSLGCGGCSNITTVESPHTCKTCGRMLCGKCGSWCKDHAPNTAFTRPPMGAAQYDTGHPNPMFIYREPRTDGGG